MMIIIGVWGNESVGMNLYVWEKGVERGGGIIVDMCGLNCVSVCLNLCRCVEGGSGWVGVSVCVYL